MVRISGDWQKRPVDMMVLLYHPVSGKTYKPSVIKKNESIMLRNLMEQNLEEESGHEQNSTGNYFRKKPLSVLKL